MQKSEQLQLQVSNIYHVNNIYRTRCLSPMYFVNLAETSHTHRSITLVNKFQLFFLVRTSTTDSYRVWAADSESVLRFAPSHQVFQLFDILYLSIVVC